MRTLLFSFIILLFTLFTEDVISQPAVGQEAPEMMGLKSLNKKLPDMKGKFILLDFWATWCMPCRETLPHVNELAGKYKDQMCVLAVSSEMEDVVRAFSKKFNYENLLYCLDVQLNLSNSFAIRAVPQFYIISPDNKIVASGNSFSLTDEMLDSIISKNTVKQIIPSKPVVLQNSSDMVSSIEIRSTPGSLQYMTERKNAYVLRDTLKYILPYLTGARCANKIRWINIPKDMIEVKLFSGNMPVDSLKMAAENMIMASYGIHKKEERVRTSVSILKVKFPERLKNRNTIEDGSLKSSNLLNDSTRRLDNYTIKEMAEVVEGYYFPRIFNVESSLTEEYDWDLVIKEKCKDKVVSFERFKQIMLKDFGIEIKESKRNVVFTTYY